MLAATLLWLILFLQCDAEDYYYNSFNISRPTLSGIAAYRSSLTLDWLAAEDSRQRELVVAYETEETPAKAVSTNCITYPRPAPGKIGRLMLEVLKNLEGDQGTLVSELIQVLVRTKILVETSILETEPDLESLVKTPAMMMAEPHTTFPRILSVIWMLVTDPASNRKHGWCPINKVNQYLSISEPHETAKQMRAMELIMVRARFIMEEFIQNVTPLNMYHKTTKKNIKFLLTEELSTQRHGIKQRANVKTDLPHQFQYMHPSSSEEPEPGFKVVDGSKHYMANKGAGVWLSWKLCIPFAFLV